jgi:hypothetical protein
MTDRIVKDPHPGLAGRIAEGLLPRLDHPAALVWEAEMEAGS